MIHKYIRHHRLGFILWPKLEDEHDFWHSHMATAVCGGRLARTEIVSAGFVEFKDGAARCYGHSESLRVRSSETDTADLNKQLGINQAL